MTEVIGPSIQAGHGMVMVIDHTDLAMTPVRMDTHPSISQSHDCFTSVINHEMLTPSYYYYSYYYQLIN